MNNKPYCPDIQPLVQSLLALLADLDFAHEYELERVEAGSAEPALKTHLRAQLEVQYRERREPYVQQLGVLEDHIKASMPDVRLGPAERAA